MASPAVVPGYNKQLSTGSELNFSPDDPVPSLPYEVVADIFQYVPPVQIITVCRLVSKTWKSFIDDPQFWQFGLRKCQNFTPKLIDIPSQNIDWPKLYLNTACGPNLIRNSVSGEFSLEPPWTISYSSWKKFSNKYGLSKVAVRKRQRHSSSSSSESEDDESDESDADDDQLSSWGGGNKWSIQSGCIKPEHLHYEQIVKENGNSAKNYVTSYEWCCRQQVIELSHHGFSDSVMDTVQPLISVSEWYCARFDCGSIFCIRVELLSSEKKVIALYEDSVETDQWQGGELGWRRVEHEFKDYGSGVRFVRFSDGGKDTQWWAGHYGSKMAGARLIVSLK